MPYLEEALDSVRAQSFKDFEVIVQDNCSTDGSLELLSRYSDLNMKIISEPDGGIGDAYNRALSRCEGEIIGSIDSDNLLMPNTLELVESYFKNNPDLAVLYSPVQMITADSVDAHIFTPNDFDLEDFLGCKLVPPFSTSFFSKVKCGDKLSFDPVLKTCADFNLWLDLHEKKIICVKEILGKTRMSDQSMTCRPESYHQFCEDKIFALDRFLAQKPALQDKAAEYKAGINIWAAESLYYILGASELTLHFLDQAAQYSEKKADQFRNEFLNQEA